MGHFRANVPDMPDTCSHTKRTGFRQSSRLVTLEIQWYTIPIHKSRKILRPASRMFARYYSGSVSSVCKCARWYAPNRLPEGWSTTSMIGTFITIAVVVDHWFSVTESRPLSVLYLRRMRLL